MASIEIKADTVITACEKSLAECESGKKFIEEGPVKDEQVNFWRRNDIDKKSGLIMKIKKLAECAMENYQSKEANLYSHGEFRACKATVTITNKDFELIGEFL